MKISKARLLQIIREEIELREKNTFELDEESLSELSDKEEKQAIEDEIDADEEAGNLRDIELEEFHDVEEDILFTKQKPHKIIQPKKQNDI
jgi:hypothetical protein